MVVNGKRRKNLGFGITCFAWSNLFGIDGYFIIDIVSLIFFGLGCVFMFYFIKY